MDKDQRKARRELFSRLYEGIRAHSVVRAMEKVPRELFVPPDKRRVAYADIPLSIGDGQTISQPYMVAMMTEALGLRGDEIVLEIGTGSGYQAAVLSTLLPKGRVVSIELVPSLAEQAKDLLQSLGYENVDVELAGPTLGCPERGPFDAIVVTAAAPQIPQTLISQLKVGGRLVAPVGKLEQQDLVVADRTGEGLSVRMLGACRFVPLLGPEGFAPVPPTTDERNGDKGCPTD